MTTDTELIAAINALYRATTNLIQYDQDIYGSRYWDELYLARRKVEKATFQHSVLAVKTGEE